MPLPAKEGENGVIATEEPNFLSNFMPSSSHRMLRIGDQIQQTLSQFLISKAHDPRFKSISISGVQVSPDMRHANVLVAPHLEVEATTHSEILTALNKASGFFRKELADKLNLRVTPQLHFVQDNTMIQADHLMKLIQNVNPTNE